MTILGLKFSVNIIQFLNKTVKTNAWHFMVCHINLH
jgi:hypothetical protein